jgi:uncharacterized Zn finger protein/DNA-binding XRE family transcriptional regulator
VSYYRWKPYVPVARRRAKAEQEMKKLARQGRQVAPVVISGRKIAHTFWGAAWCDHLEKFSDYENRLPRGRTYVRNGSVCHLGIDQGRIEAIVSGSSLYQIEIRIDPLPPTQWQQLRDQCTGKIGSALELLQGRLSTEVMQIVTHRDQGLFPKPGELHMSCSCPDWASLCKHLAAVLYGIGARLDTRPELLFQLRGVDPQELITADLDLTRSAAGKGKRRRLEEDDLAGLFGVEIDAAPVVPPGPPPGPPPEPPRAKAAPAPPATPGATARRPPPRAAGFNPSGPAVAELRARLGLNKTQFARLVGVTPPTIGNWEKRPGALDLQAPHLAALRKIARMKSPP